MRCGIMIVLLGHTPFLSRCDVVAPRIDTEPSVACSPVPASHYRIMPSLHSALHRDKQQPCHLERRNGVGARNSSADLYLPTCTMPKLLKLCIALSKTLSFLNGLRAFARKGNILWTSRVKSLLSPVALGTSAVLLPEPWPLQGQ